MKELVIFAVEIAEIVAAMGGRLFLVGGAVRDAIMGKVPHDHDFVVTGITVEAFREVFGKVEIPEELTRKKNGEKIKAFVRDERIRRIRKMRAK